MIVDRITPKQRASLERRFWDKVDRSGGPDTPWTWKGHFNRKYKGYGYIWVCGRKEVAHRVAWELINGPIPEGMKVLHKYDDPLNVNPSHLFLGTQKDNVHDMFQKNRAFVPNGLCSKKAVLNIENVKLIRQLHKSGLGCRRIGKIIGASHGTVQCVIRGDTWRYVS